MFLKISQKVQFQWRIFCLQRRFWKTLLQLLKNTQHEVQKILGKHIATFSKFLSFSLSKFHWVGKVPPPSVFGETYSDVFENVAICSPKIFVLYLLKISVSGKVPTIQRMVIQQRFGETYALFPLKISLSRKIPTVLSFFFFFLVCFPYKFFHSFFFSFFFLFFFSLKQTSLPTSIFSLPPPLSLLHTQPPPATAITLATTHCHHHSLFLLFWCSSFFKV